MIDSIELPADIHNISSKQPFYCASDNDKMVIRCYLPGVELGHRSSSMWLLHILLVKWRNVISLNRLRLSNDRQPNKWCYLCECMFIVAVIITTYSSRKIMSLGILQLPLDQVLNISYH